MVVLLLFSLGQFDKLGISLLFVNHSLQQTFQLIHDPAAAGLLMTSFLIAYGVAIFPWGLLIRRVGLGTTSLCCGVALLARGF